MDYPRNTGRTTRRIVKAFALFVEGKKVVFITALEENADRQSRIFMQLCQSLHIEHTVMIKNRTFTSIYNQGEIIFQRKAKSSTTTYCQQGYIIIDDCDERI